MIVRNDTRCSKCDGNLKYYDSVKRCIKGKYGIKRYMKIRRFKCSECGAVHREATEDIYPYKQYEAEIIFGVTEGLITPDTLGFEDYPCEATMRRWLAQNLQRLL